MEIGLVLGQAAQVPSPSLGAFKTAGSSPEQPSLTLH